MTYIIGWDMNFKKKTFGNNYSKFPSPSMTLSSKSFLRIVLFFSESLFSSWWYFSSSSKLAISFSRAMIARLSFSLSSMIADSFSIRWNLFVLFRSRLLLLLEAIRRIRRTLSLTWNVIWGFDGVCNPCWNTHCQILFIQNCGLPWLQNMIDEFR